MVVRYERPLHPDELMHFGVLGMKWGIRRYQNYDGSYTKKGLEHYRKSEKRYNNAKSAYDNAKLYGKNTKAAKSELNAAKHQLKKDYKQLKLDKRADQGKRLYQEGRTITQNVQNASVRESATAMATVAAGYAFAGKYLRVGSSPKLYDLGKIAPMAIAIGGTVVNGILTAHENSQNKKLRAYYSHSRR